VCYTHGAVNIQIKRQCSTDGCTNQSVKNGRCRHHKTVAAEAVKSFLPTNTPLSPIEISIPQPTELSRLQDLVLKLTEENNRLKALLQEQAKDKVAIQPREKKGVQLPMPTSETLIKEIMRQRRWETFTNSLDVHDENERIVISFVKNCIPKNIVDNWVVSTKRMAEELGDKYLYHTDRKRYSDDRPIRSGHFFCWRKYKEFTHLTSLMKFKCVQEWARKNQPLWEKVEEVFKSNFPMLYKLYNSVARVPERVGGFAAVAVNYNIGPMKRHRDTADYQNGICLVVVGGEFTGGELSFPELKMKFAVQPGDVIAFRSYLLVHEVLNYNGERYSAVFFQDQNVFSAVDAMETGSLN